MKFLAYVDILLFELMYTFLMKHVLFADLYKILFVDSYCPDVLKFYVVNYFLFINFLSYPFWCRGWIV